MTGPHAKGIDTVPYRWQQQYVAAKTAIKDRDAKVADVAELIERNLVLQGCTAIG